MILKSSEIPSQAPDGGVIELANGGGLGLGPSVRLPLNNDLKRVGDEPSGPVEQTLPRFIREPIAFVTLSNDWLVDQILGSRIDPVLRLDVKARIRAVGLEVNEV